MQQTILVDPFRHTVTMPESHGLPIHFHAAKSCTLSLDPAHTSQPLKQEAPFRLRAGKGQRLAIGRSRLGGAAQATQQICPYCR